MVIRSYQDGDENQILALDRSLELHPWNSRDLNNWYWKYTGKNPSGRAFIWLIQEGNAVIAHFAAVPYKLKVFNEELAASHTIAALVEEKYQNRGLLKFLGDKLFAELEEKAIPFTYGFPNLRAYNLHISHMGYQDLIKFDTWIIKKPGLENAASGSLKPQEFCKIEKFSRDFDALWAVVKNGYKIAVVRDSNYLNWRYLSRPDVKYYPFACYKDGRTSGYVVLKLYREDKVLRGHILDIFAHYNDRDTLNLLIEASLNFFKAHNVDEATCWVWGSKLIEEILNTNGFIQEPTAKPLVIRVNNQDFKYKKETLDNKNWYFTMGDSTEIF